MKKSVLRKSTSLLLVLMMILPVFGGIGAFAEREYAADIMIGGVTVDFKDEPYSKFDTVFFPLEELCGYLGMEFTREGSTYTIKRMRDTITMDIGNIVMNVNGRTVLLKNSLTLRNDIVYAPVEIFSEAFKCPVTMSEDFRSADIKPNVYSIAITQENAAAISAAEPDKDTLVTSDSGADKLFYKPSESPEKEIAVFYKVDLSDYMGKDIENATLALHVARGSNVNQSITVQRTAPWVKGALNFNNQPEFISSQSVTVAIPSELKQSAKNWGDMSFNITSLFRGALSDGQELSMKLLGVPYRNQQNPGTPQAHVKGVNTPTAPHILVTVKEAYTFPVKQPAAISADDAKYDELQLLYSMGVFTENDEFPLDMNEAVTRGEFITYAMRLRGSDIPVGKTTQFFSDVPVDSPYFAVTSSAYELGYISGWEGIEFRPYDAITIGEAITILGRMLDYDVYADERGGFTPGYFEAAKHGELYLGVNDNKTLVSFNKMIDLLENSLDAKMLDVIKFNADGSSEYVFNENKTILTEFWDAQKIEGVVTANEYGNIIPGVNGEEGYIAIDGKKLHLNYKPYNNYLGYKVKGYYSRNEEVLLYIGTVISDTTTVKLADIEAKSDTSSTVSFSYRKKNGKLATESFLKTSTVIYNGKSIAPASVSSSLLSADGGDITLVGTSLVIINAYRTVIAFGVDSEKEIIYDYYEEYDNTVRLDGKEWSVTDKNGKAMDLTDIKMYDVLSVAESADGKYISAVVERRSIDGKIDLVQDPGTADEVLTIGALEYETANRNEKWTKHLMLGAEGKFLLDKWGNIVAFIPALTTEIPGYLIAIDYAAGSTLSKKLEAAVMVSGSEDYVTYRFADKIEVDGNKLDTTDEILGYFLHDVVVGKDADNNDIVEQRVKDQGMIFSLNSNKEINCIDTEILGPGEDEETSLRYMAKGDEELRFKSGSGKLSDKFFWKIADSLSVVSTDDSGSLDSYMTITSGVANDERVKPHVYTVGKDNPDTSIVYLKNYRPGSGADSNYYVVDRVVTAFDSDGYEIKKIYYHTAPGEIKNVIVPDDMLYLLDAPEYDSDNVLTAGNAKTRNGVKRGDIIKIGTDALGELSALVEYFDYDDKVLMNLNTGFASSERTYGGYTTKLYNENIKVAPDLNTMDTSYYWVKFPEVTNLYRYEVNNAGVELFPATFDDIRPYDKVPYNPTGMLLQATYARIDGVNFLLDMNQPEGTGIYSLKYEPNLPEGVSESELTAFPQGAERFNPGDIAQAKPKSAVTLKNYEFVGWTDKATGEEIAPEGDVFINGNVVLQARWIANPSIDFIFTDADDPSMRFTMPYQQYSFATGTQSQVYQALPTAEIAGNSTNNFKKAGKTLIGWEGEDGTRYMLNNTVDPESELYAVPGQTETFKAIWMKAWSGTAATEAPSTTVINGNTYYQITDGEDLAWFANYVNSGNFNANAILMDDIYLNNFLDEEGDITSNLGAWYDDATKLASAKMWIDRDSTNFSIGNGKKVDDVNRCFKGIFDGNGKTIHGMYIEGSSTNSYFGLFGNVSGATIKNLDVSAPYIVSRATSATSRVVGVVVVMAHTASNTTVDVTNVNVIGGKVTSGGPSFYVPLFGSILTYAATSNDTHFVNVKNCTSSITIDFTNALPYTNTTTNTGTGGIVGRAKGAGGGLITIENCAFNGHIALNSSSTSKAAGILGRGADGGSAKANAIIKNCSGNYTVASSSYINAVGGSNWTASGTNTTSYTVVAP